MRAFKEVAAAVLIIIIIVITLGALLYNKVPTIKNIGAVEKYEKSKKVIDLVDSNVSKDDLEDKVVLKTYSLDDNQIKSLKEQQIYNQGRSNPFSSLNNEAIPGAATPAPANGSQSTNTSVNQSKGGSNVTSTDNVQQNNQNQTIFTPKGGKGQ